MKGQVAPGGKRNADRYERAVQLAKEQPNLCMGHCMVQVISGAQLRNGKIPTSAMKCGISYVSSSIRGISYVSSSNV